MAVIELAAALAAIATKTLVAELLRGDEVSTDSWAEVGVEVVGAMMTSATRQSSGLRELSRQIDELGDRIDAIPQREFDQHMAAGRRYLRDLPVRWRTRQDRRELIRDARAEFVRAVAIAELRHDVPRQALAEVALAACWLWVPSVEDVRNTIRQARMLLENEILFGATDPLAAFVDVFELSKAYREAPANAARPIIGMPLAPARLAVHAQADRWVECAGVEVKIKERVTTAAEPRPRVSALPDGEGWNLVRRQPFGVTDSALGPATEQVTFEVRNNWDVWISLSLTDAAVVARISHDGMLPRENQVQPNSTATFTLSRPQLLSRGHVPLWPTVGFVLPAV